jgi:hypothetical protein
MANNIHVSAADRTDPQSRVAPKRKQAIPSGISLNTLKMDNGLLRSEKQQIFMS